MAFDDVLFPIPLSRGSGGGPEFSTDITELGSGYEQRNRNWYGARMMFDVGSRDMELADYELLKAFFYERAGRSRAFRYRDPLDAKSCSMLATPAATDQLLGLGNDATQTFQLVKRYGSGSTEHVRTITKPKSGTVKIARGGVTVTTGFTIDHLTGVVTFDTPPAAGVAVTAGFEFHVPVRFDTDKLSPLAINRTAVTLPELPLVEVRA